MGKLKFWRLMTASIVFGAMAGCGQPGSDGDAEAADPAEAYRATIRWTSHGIPHVKAQDWGSLGYGFAYAVATNGICVLAEEVMRVRGEQSRYLGPGDGRREADVFHRAIITPELIVHTGRDLPPQMDALQDGYVAGYNRFLADHEGRLPQTCREAPWVQPITREDLARIAIASGSRYGLGRAQNGIVTAHPPAAQPVMPATEAPDAADAAAIDPPLSELFGSNAIALGRAATPNGRGLLLGNPHFPWRGPNRFHIAHLTIPGEIDSMGTGLLTTPIISIGFNADIAWTHTVSTAMRFTLFELPLVPGTPTAYRFGDEERPIEERTVTISVRNESGELVDEEHRIYVSHLGPVLMEDEFPWTPERAYVIADANVTNNRGPETYLRFNTARSVSDILAALRETQGVAWVNTIAADRHGGALYADISVVPNVTEELIERCRSEHARTWRGMDVVVLRAEPGCEWRQDPEARDRGILPPDALPHLMRDDFVSNSNDSYWLTNPAEPLEGFSPIIGRERYPQSLRTRAGLHFIGELRGTENGPFDAEAMRELMYSHRNYAAELLLEDVLAVCGDESPAENGGATVDAGAQLAEACRALGEWDRRHDVASRGAQVWTEFWPAASRHERLWAVPFDANDPVNTPRGIAIDRDDVRDHVRASLVRAVQTLDEAGVPLDASWGNVHFEQRDGVKIGIPGGRGDVGMFSNMFAQLRPGEGYTPMIAGNSWIQVVGWDDDGRVEAHGILTYSQSQEPDSPHHADQTRLYSEGRWIELPFTETQIESDPNLRIVELEGR
jgi:acyl-homoserine-lactone acylase